MDHKPKDIYVALMGLTGAGKSSFINHCIKHEVIVGDGLQACTETVETFSFDYSPGVTIHLVDTPGFDDTNRQDSAVLRDISAWLSKSYTEKGSGKMSIHLLRKLCGKDAFKNVVLVTTMWELVEADVGNRREKEIEETEEFWGFMKRHGSQIRRHQNTAESAREILSMFVPQTSDVHPESVALAIQKELADEHKSLDQTGAGQLLDGTWAKEKEALKRELEDVREAVKAANEERDHMMAKLMQDQQKEMDINVKRIQMEQEKLRVTMEELHQERLSKYQQMLDEQMEVSRKLGKDLDERSRLGEEEREKRQMNTIQQREKLQEQETAISELQNRLSVADLSSTTLGSSEAELKSKHCKTHIITGIPNKVTSLLLSSDGNTLFVGTEKRKIFVYNLGPNNDWRRCQVISCGGILSGITSKRNDSVRHLMRSEDDKCLVAACGSKTFQFKFDNFASKLEMVYQMEHYSERGFFALSSDGRYQLSASSGSQEFVLSVTDLSITNGTVSTTNFMFSLPPWGSTGSRNNISCLELDGSDIAVGFASGDLMAFQIWGIAGPIQQRGEIEIPGSILSVDWLSGGRLLVGTEEGLYIVDPEGNIDRIDKKRMLDDLECWLCCLEQTVGFYGTVTGRAHVCNIEEERLLPARYFSCAYVKFSMKTRSTRNGDMFRLAYEGSDSIGILTTPLIIPSLDSTT